MLVELQEHARIVVVIDERAAVELVEQRLIAIAVRDPGIAAVLRGVEARNGVGLDDERAVRGHGHVPADVGDLACQRHGAAHHVNGLGPERELQAGEGHARDRVRMIVDEIVLIHGVREHDTGADVDHRSQRVLTAVGDVLFDGGREHRGKQIRPGRRGHGVKAHDAHGAGVELRERRMLLDVFFHDAAGICAQIRECVCLFGLGRCREDAHARALTLAVGLVDDLSGVTGERAQQHRVHGGRLHAAAAVKVGKDLGEDKE